MKLMKRLQICSQDYSIFSVRVGEVKGMGDADGYTDIGRGKIYIAKSILKNTSRTWDTIIHEICHAILDASGVGFYMKTHSKKKGRKWNRFEEDMIRMFAPAIFGAIRSLGLIDMKAKFK